MFVYQIQIEGHLDLAWAGWLELVEIEHLPDGSTRLIGQMPDQAALYGLLFKLRDLGASLISVQRSSVTTNKEFLKG